jgi:glycosyltransferase involved in cell wall biosynthesis
MQSQRRLRVLWLSHFVPYPPKGGMLLRSYNLIREVARHHDIDLLLFAQKKPLQTMFPSVEQGIREARSHLLDFCKTIEVFDIPCEQSSIGRHWLALKSLFTFDPYTINWLKSSTFVDRIKVISTEDKYDVIHFDTISLAYVAGIFANTPNVLNHHNVESHMLLRRAEQESNPFKRIYFSIEGRKLEAYEKQHCRRFDVNVMCSDLDKARLSESVQGIRLETISNGVDIEYFRRDESIAQEPNSLIFVGGLNWYPNAAAMHFFALKIWPLLKQRCPDIVMNIVGQDPTPLLTELAAEDSNFRVHGFVDDVRPYMNRAQVYVCPIKDGGGTKLKILDALAMEKSIVADEIACEGIDVTDGTNVVFAQSPEQYVDAIVKVLASAELRTSLGRNGRQLVRDHYSYHDLGNRLARIYSTLS